MLCRDRRCGFGLGSVLPAPQVVPKHVYDAATASATTALKTRTAAQFATAQLATAAWPTPRRSSSPRTAVSAPQRQEAARKPLVIGENMARVRQYADEIGGHAYRPWSGASYDVALRAEPTNGSQLDA